MVNKIKAVGVLCDTRRGEYGYSEIMLLIKRGGQEDLYATFTLDTVLDPSITVKQIVEVEGYFRGYNSKQPDGSWKVVRYMVATKVKKAISAIEQEYGVKGNFAPKHYYYAAVEGELNVVLNSDNGWKILGLKVYGNGQNGYQEHPQYISVDVNPSPKMPNINEFKKGDVIATILNMKTPKREYNGEVKVWEDLVVEDLVVVGHNEPRTKDGQNTEKSAEKSEEGDTQGSGTIRKPKKRKGVKNKIEVRNIPEDKYPGGKKKYTEVSYGEKGAPILEDVDIDDIDDVDEVDETPTGE